MHEIVEKHNQVLDRVYNEDYYIHIVEKHMDNYKKIDTPELVCSFWNDVWYDLPDSPVIRKGPFFDICDLAEGEYIDDDVYMDFK